MGSKRAGATSQGPRVCVATAPVRICPYTRLWQLEQVRLPLVGLVAVEALWVRVVLGAGEKNHGLVAAPSAQGGACRASKAG